MFLVVAVTGNDRVAFWEGIVCGAGPGMVLLNIISCAGPRMQNGCVPEGAMLENRLTVLCTIDHALRMVRDMDIIWVENILHHCSDLNSRVADSAGREGRTFSKLLIELPSSIKTKNGFNSRSRSSFCVAGTGHGN